MNRWSSASTAIIAFALLGGSPVRGDTTITLKNGNGDSQSVIAVKGHMARMTDSQGQGYLLYDKARNLVIQVDTENKQYLEVDHSFLKQRAEAMAKLREQVAVYMKEQIEQVPPEQRALLEARMNSFMDQAENPPPPTEIRVEKNEDKTVNGFGCRQHALYEAKQKVAEVCLARPEEAQVSSADYATLMAMMDFMRDMAQGVHALGNDSDPLLMSGLQGIPVSMKDLKRGEDYVLAGVSNEKLDEALFIGYKSYRKQEINPATPEVEQ